MIQSIKKYILLSGILSVFLFTTVPVVAQNLPTNVDVSKLSDAQINRIVTEVNDQGLSLDEAVSLAKVRGATQSQVNDLMRRIQELNFTKGNPISAGGAHQTSQPTGATDVFSVKQQLPISDQNKKVFGFSLFNSTNLTFEPSVNIPTPQSYVLGINDELLITVWGASQQTYQTVIGQNGAITIPDIGPIFLKGMELNEARKAVKQRLLSIYNGMAGDNPNTYAEVSISNLRSIKVSVVGEVIAPGTYTLPATATAFNALYLSGGPNANGSFRNIKVIRDNKVVSTIDVYDFLINASTSGNIQLREQDVLLIPTYSTRVELTGAFKRLGYFELTTNETIASLIKYGGGWADNAFQNNLSVTRITDSEQKLITIDATNFATFKLKNGDVINAGTVIGRFENRVTISGAVFRPGEYELIPGLTLLQLINKAQGLREDVFLYRGHIVRLTANLTTEIIPFDIQNVLNGSSDIILQREDSIIIQDISSMREERFVRIFGEVQNPAQYAWSENMNLKDIVFKAGGFKEAASLSFIEIARRHDYAKASSITDDMVSLFQFEIGRDLKIDPSNDHFKLKPYDYIYVRKAPSYFEQKTVSINGEIKFPGEFSILKKSERVSDLVLRAGGLTPSAFIDGAMIYRVNANIQNSFEAIENMQTDSFTDKAVNQLDNTTMELRLREILANPGCEYDYLLKEGDHIVIPELVQEVRISGEILNPIGLAFEKDRGLKYYIHRSGGFSTNAKKGKVFVIYRNGTTMVTKNFLVHNYPPIEPGCQIIVPSKPEKQRTDNTGKFLAFSSTLASIAVALAAILR